ncbi:Rieske 2Fe-2S domain-containing protein [Leucobacter allii]|uniref:Rieske 2Fe-2S domain-containing protein n=1 Tax=Leucobacter allii TaxID=2932247 RepID=A0ABY4FMH9_9MICO|nr:Rieske 2Fe-2S domain-containing protein [Leucobacter allii]UOQ57458.1 Rieske 2Fe-2S domain-containing protein [Leucobacter allii]
MSQGIDIGAWQDFPDRQMVSVEVGGMELGVCRWGERIYAFRNACPHEGAPLCAGFLQKKLTAETSIARDAPDVALTVSEDEPVVLCPWHRWEFQLEDGAAAAPGFRMRTYRVRREADRVVLSLGRK